MKKCEVPTLEVIILSAEDVITTSGLPDETPIG